MFGGAGHDFVNPIHISFVLIVSVQLHFVLNGPVLQGIYCFLHFAALSNRDKFVLATIIRILDVNVES
jgi:hypothetical protein